MILYFHVPDGYLVKTWERERVNTIQTTVLPYEKQARKRIKSIEALLLSGQTKEIDTICKILSILFLFYSAPIPSSLHHSQTLSFLCPFCIFSPFGPHVHTHTHTQTSYCVHFLSVHLLEKCSQKTWQKLAQMDSPILPLTQIKEKDLYCGFLEQEVRFNRWVLLEFSVRI